jgi:PAS domain S-box-containing protein
MATILIVDEHPENRALLVDLLGKHGHHLIQVGDGLEALTIARTFDPELIIAEFLMPTMDGCELVHQLRTDPQSARIPVIFWVFDFQEHEARNLAQSCGVSHVLIKSATPDQIFSAVNDALNLKKTVLASPHPAPAGETEVRLSEKNAGLTAANQRLAALIDVSLQLINVTDMPCLIDILARSARDLVGAKCAAVAINKSGANRPEFFTSAGLSSEAAAACRSRLPDSVAIRNLIRMRVPCRLTSLSGDAKAMGFPPEYPPVYSFLGAPILASTGPCGWISLTNKLGADAFTDEDEHIVAILAAKAGRIYENRTLYGELHAKATELENEIAERKRSDELLSDSLKHVSELRDALDQHAIVAITDPQGKITFVNDKFCQISKYSREELIGQDHRIINSGHHPKAFMHDLWGTIAHGKVWRGEIKNRAKDGSFYWVDTTIVPFFNRDGKPRQYVAIRADITQRKLAEEALRQANETLETKVAERTRDLRAANQELEAFSYSISHDLRAPLRHISGYVDLLRPEIEGSLSEKNAHYFTSIRQSAEQMTQLIENLLEFSRMGRVEFSRERVDLNVLLRHAIAGLEAETKDRRIVWKTSPLPEIIGDAAMLAQVFANLLSNAVKYTRPRDPAQIEIGSGGQRESQAVIFVRDNGVGFDMEYAEKLFGVFQRMHAPDEFEGIGIGLANVHRIITRLGGHVWAESKVDAGATFYFTLPFAEARQ